MANPDSTPEGRFHDDLIPSPLTTTLVGSRVLVLDRVSSTNDHALRLGGEGVVIVADSQISGRGRHGRSWESAPGLGLWFSVVFEEPLEGLVFAAGLAVREAVMPWCRLEPKWPNDLTVGGKKLCGLLAERRGNRTALGIGINVKHGAADFPPELRDRAISIEAASGRPCPRGELLRAVLTLLDRKVMVVREAGPAQFLREWTDACAILGKRVRSGGVEGVAVDVDSAGALLVDTGGEVRPVVFGEIVEIANGMP